MKPYRIHIVPTQGAPWSYTGLFADGFAAIVAALDLTQGSPARISARRLA